MPLVSPNYSDLLDKPDVYVNRFEEYTTRLATTPEGIQHAEELAQEAVAVGISLVPLYYFTAKVVDKFAPNLFPETRALVNVALSAGLFHIICEETGVNNWFLSNSVAARKSKRKWWKVSTTAAGQSIELCDGKKCGAGACKGIPHSDFH
jgi:hypothetical protein